MFRINRKRLSLPSLLLVCLFGSAVCAAEEVAGEAEADAETVVATTPVSPNDLPLPLDEIRIFAQVLNQIRSAYVEDIDDKTLLENAIKGMLAGIDPHSTYLAADDYDTLQESTTGEFGGLGVEVGIENGFIKIIAPMDESPADRAGVKAGDLIIKIDDTPARDVTLGDTSDLLRGEPGTSVTLTLMRDGSSEPLEITVVREIITSRSIRYRELEPGYGYIRIATFAVNTANEVVAALEKLHKGEVPLEGVILDLRNNPGGVLKSGVDVVDAFIKEGLIVYTRGRVPNADLRFEATPEDPSLGVPLVVLINGGSASASEIVAGALQDHKRAVIMGTPSFGKGSVQTVLPLTNDRAIKLTTALYLTPNGRSIQAKGITPDINIDRGQVTRIPDSVTAYREADLSGHLESADQNAEVTEYVPPPATQNQATTPPPEVLVNDYQLYEALNLLKAVTVVRAQM